MSAQRANFPRGLSECSICRGSNPNKHSYTDRLQRTGQRHALPDRLYFSTIHFSLNQIMVCCRLCGAKVPQNNYTDHFRRCSSIGDGRGAAASEPVESTETTRCTICSMRFDARGIASHFRRCAADRASLEVGAGDEAPEAACTAPMRNPGSDVASRAGGSEASAATAACAICGEHFNAKGLSSHSRRCSAN